MQPNIIGNEEDLVAQDPDNGLLGITLKEIAKKVRTPKEMYDLCCHVGYYMPPLNTSLCSNKFMAQLLTQECFSFMVSHIRHKTLYGNPKKSEMRATLLEALRAQARSQASQ